MTLDEISERFEEFSNKCPSIYKRAGLHVDDDCLSYNNKGNGKCNELSCPYIKPAIIKYQAWQCKTCPAKCVIQFDEIYENPNVCPHDIEVRTEFELVEFSNYELLSKFKKIVSTKREFIEPTV